MKKDQIIVDLSNLPTYNRGIYWKESEGLCFNFQCGNISGKIKIEKYVPNGKHPKVELSYDKRKFIVGTNKIASGQLYDKIFNINHGYRYKIGQIISDENRELFIVDQIKTKNNDKAYKYMCFKCGYDNGTILEGNLDKGAGCGCCCSTPRVVVPGINDLATTHPNLIDYFVDKNDATKCTHGSSKIYPIKCPFCGHIFDDIPVSSLYKFRCSHCSDGISYPEKFIIALLNQLNINFKTQLSHKTFSWCEKYKYDFYINSKNAIIETHGLQHYETTSGWMRSSQSLAQRQLIDSNKKELAQRNGISHYISLDCRYSKLEYIKNSILESELPELLDFSGKDIDWEKCDVFARSSYCIEACNMYNDGCSIEEISQKLIVDESTVRSYLKQGNINKLCNFNTIHPSYSQYERKLRLVKLIYNPDNGDFYFGMDDFRNKVQQTYNINHLSFNMYDYYLGENFYNVDGLSFLLLKDKYFYMNKNIELYEQFINLIDDDDAEG